MKHSFRFLLIFGLLFTQAAWIHCSAQFTNTSHGIIVTIDGKKVELAVAKIWRISP